PARSLAEGEPDAAGPEAHRLAAGVLAFMERHLDAIVRPGRRQERKRRSEERGSVREALQDGVGHVGCQAALSGKEPQEGPFALEGNAETAASSIGSAEVAGAGGAFLSLDAHLKAPCRLPVPWS